MFYLFMKIIIYIYKKSINFFNLIYREFFMMFEKDEIKECEKKKDINMEKIEYKEENGEEG